MKKTLVVLLLLILSTHVVCASERIALVVDTSGSMRDNDRPRYAAQISKILGDLVDDDDSLIFIRMPPQERALDQSLGAALAARLLNQYPPEICTAGPAPDLAVELRGSDRAAFKSTLDRLVVDDTGTYFAIPLATAFADKVGGKP